MAEPTDCVNTLGGYEAKVGYVREAICGTTPAAAHANYWTDPVGPTQRFHAFGKVISFEPEFNTNQIKKRGLGNQGNTCNKHGKYEVSVSVNYYPMDLSRLTFVLGDNEDIGIDPHEPSSSFARIFNRTAPNAIEKWELYNMMKIDTFTIDASLDDFIQFSEELIGQYLQISDTGAFVGFQTVTTGKEPDEKGELGCDPIMFYEGDIFITREASEDVSAQFTGFETDAIVAFSPMDWLLAGSNYEDSDKDSVEVLVNGLPVPVISVVYATKTITLAGPPGGGDTVVVNYHYVDRLFNVSDYSIEVARNLIANHGMVDGLAIAYEIVEGIFGVTGSLTTNFNSYAQFDQYIADEYFHLIIGLGGIKDVYLKRAKWDIALPPASENDLIAEELEFEAEDFLLKNPV